MKILCIKSAKIILFNFLSKYYVLVVKTIVFYNDTLFFSMTGVGGRPEIVIEGTNDINNGPWKVCLDIFCRVSMR